MSKYIKSRKYENGQSTEKVEDMKMVEVQKGRTNDYPTILNNCFKIITNPKMSPNSENLRAIFRTLFWGVNDLNLLARQQTSAQSLEMVQRCYITLC